MYSIAAPTVWIFSASSSGMEISNSSSNSITSSTVSRESAPRSFTNDVSLVILSGDVPIWLQTMRLTRSSIEGFVIVLVFGSIRGEVGLACPAPSEAEPAVDDQDLSRDVGATGTHQVIDRERDLFRGSDSLQRDGRSQFPGGGLSHLGGHVGLDEARGDGVHAHAARGELLGRRARQAQQAGLAGGVVRLPRIAHQAHDRGDVYDPPARLHQRARGGPEEVPGALQVDRDHAIEVLLRHA